MLNLPIRLNLQPDVDPEKIAEAIGAAVRAHPVLQGTAEKENGEWVLRYRPEMPVSFPVEKMTDEEMEKEAASFVRPFTLNGEPLFRCRIIRGESRCIVLLDVYHVICDGFSGMKPVADIIAAFGGTVPGEDWSCQLMLEEKENRSSERFREDMACFAARYDRPGWEPARNRTTNRIRTQAGSCSCPSPSRRRSPPRWRRNTVSERAGCIRPPRRCRCKNR